MPHFTPNWPPHLPPTELQQCRYLALPLLFRGCVVLFPFLGLLDFLDFFDFAAGCAAAGRAAAGFAASGEAVQRSNPAATIGANFRILFTRSSCGQTPPGIGRASF